MNAILLWQWVVRERLGMVNIPRGMRGMPLELLTACLLALVLMRFSGVDGGLRALLGLN